MTPSGPHLIAKAVYRRIVQLFRRESPPQIALLSGGAGLNDPVAAAVPHKIWAHSFDFDIYLELRSQAQSTSAPYAVFLDEDMIYHSDYDHLGIEPPTTEAAYYGPMKSFFKRLEQQIGMPVVIAAHPRSRYDLRPHLWNGHATIRGRTAELVRDATLVLCHLSTSVGLAVLWHKPVITLTTNDIRLSYWGDAIALMSKALGAPLINVDAAPAEWPALTSVPEVNEEAYAMYREEYIKRSNTPEKPLWQIFADYVRSELRMAD
jgi:hypothetical protein